MQSSKCLSFPVSAARYLMMWSCFRSSRSLSIRLLIVVFTIAVVYVAQFHVVLMFQQVFRTPLETNVDRGVDHGGHADRQSHVDQTQISSKHNTSAAYQVTKEDKTRKEQSQESFNSVANSWRVLTKAYIHKVDNIFPPNAAIPMTVTSALLIPNAEHCSLIKNLTYVVVVHSSTEHFDRRQSLRRTWANHTFFQNISSRTVFLLGQSLNTTVQQEIKKESDYYGDIVQGIFIDHYFNLTLKAVMGLRWVSENCRNAKFVVKVDDDVFVNMPAVLQNVFPVISTREKEIVCFVEPKATIFRQTMYKWDIPHDYFPKLKTYPMPICYGFANFYRTSLAAELFEVSKSTPFFRLDDVYVYGILASKVEGLTWRNAAHVMFKSESETLAAFKKTIASWPLVGTARSYSLMDMFWKYTQT